MSVKSLFESIKTGGNSLKRTTLSLIFLCAILLCGCQQQSGPQTAYSRLMSGQIINWTEYEYPFVFGEKGALFFSANGIE